VAKRTASSGRERSTNPNGSFSSLNRTLGDEIEHVDACLRIELACFADRLDVMVLAEYGVRDGGRISVAMTLTKLIIQPLVVWLLARLLGLPPMETRVVVLLASPAVGVNVYLMSRQFNTLEAPVASSLVLSTALAALTTPLALALTVA